MLKRLRNLLGSRRTQTPDAAEASTVEAVSAPTATPPIIRGPRVVHRPIPESSLDPDAVKIIRRLSRFDHSAYLVGGCVRDLLLDRRPKDFDVGTSATPSQVRRLFRNCRIIGRRFRLAHIYFQNGKIIEVATFRAQDLTLAEGEEDGRRDLLIRDDNLFGTPEEDALRRDFTINSLFYDLSNGTVLDYAEGLEDLRQRLVRTIGDPEIRFREDPIRILRAIKFAARLDFEIEARTLEALRRTRGVIPRAAPPRILEELNRFCRDGAARRSFELMRKHEILEVVLPEIAAAFAADGAEALLFDLLEGLDESQRRGSGVTTGEMLAALLLPGMAEEIGWRADGTAKVARDPDLLRIANRWLGPLVARLRLARKDQEHFRQILLALARMVPQRRLRSSTHRGLLRRSALPQALWILERLAANRGGDFSRAWERWKHAAAERGSAPEPARTDRGSPSRRGRRSGRRGRRAARPAEARARPRPIKAAEGQVWSDDYFFTALPSAPADGVEAAGDSVYGDAELPDPDGGPGRSGAKEAAAQGGAQGRRRRRRPRRRRRRRADGAAPSGEKKDERS